MKVRIRRDVPEFDSRLFLSLHPFYIHEFAMSKQTDPFQIGPLLKSNTASSMRGIGAGVMLVALFATAHTGTGQSAIAATAVGRTAQQGCTPQGGLSFLCGPESSEDLVRLPGTRWLIASGLNVGHPAHLFLIDTRTRAVSAVYPDAAVKPRAAAGLPSRCVAAPDPATFSIDGLALRPGQQGVHTLYASNHGGREAIEVFEVDARGRRPVLRWTGCIPMPTGTRPNAVTVLPDGGVLAISFHDPADPKAWERMARGEDTGRIFEWQPDQGLREVPGSHMSGGNGIAVSADATEIYASAWSGARLVVLSRPTGQRREIPLPFLPDNLHRLDDGTLLVGGQRTTVGAVARCQGPRCPQPWVVARVDPSSGSVETLLEGPGDARVDYACGAIAVDGTLYVTVRGDRRLVVAPFKYRMTSH